ncbi:hypothetical protein ACH5RR_036938 [Cinchona calisaya]|uniref:Uncharacterized protein n=1 Tax=Cinchona calisaya TaxID=153742 RepID=A0ABD2Y939_9GENT
MDFTKVVANVTTVQKIDDGAAAIEVEDQYLATVAAVTESQTTVTENVVITSPRPSMTTSKRNDNTDATVKDSCSKEKLSS